MLYSLAVTAPAPACAQDGPPLAEILRESPLPPETSGVYVLEKGDEALLSRFRLFNSAEQSIEILTLIWSLDRIGLLATEALLRAADRGVKVRMLVDDFHINPYAQEILLALSLHPNIEIRVYNPLIRVGVSFPRRVYNLFSQFRLFNQRLHNKSLIVDGLAGITGGRNIADEYYDYDQDYNFRDRDILVVGAVVADMRRNFEAFWNCSLSRPMEELLAHRLDEFTDPVVERIYEEMRACARDMTAQTPVVREALADQPRRFAAILDQLVWNEVRYVSDYPWKNKSRRLDAGGLMRQEIEAAIASARERIVIQSPYFILPKGGLGLFEKLEEGVKVRVSTNSLASTDNIATFAGYQRHRRRYLAAGMEIREFRPDPPIAKELIRRFRALEESGPIFTMHSKTLVIDGELLYIGTYNIDPRAANLNTEDGVFIRHPELARQVEERIEADMLPENSWNPAEENPDRHAPMLRRIGTFFLRLLPLEPLL